MLLTQWWSQQKALVDRLFSVGSWQLWHQTIVAVRRRTAAGKRVDAWSRSWSWDTEDWISSLNQHCRLATVFVGFWLAVVSVILAFPAWLRWGRVQIERLNQSFSGRLISWNQSCHVSITRNIDICYSSLQNVFMFWPSKSHFNHLLIFLKISHHALVYTLSR